MTSISIPLPVRILPDPLELDRIGQYLREVGGTRPADLVFDPTFAC
jgi:hypothetical protein